MPEARDRLPRPDEMTMFLRRRRSTGSLGILADDSEVCTFSPFRWGPTALTSTNRVAPTGGSDVGRADFGASRVGNGRGRSVYGSPAVYGRENTPAGSRFRARGSRSVLPSWYPRKPLRDITPIMQAIERRRSHLREADGQQLMSPSPQGQNVHIPFASESGAPLEHDHSLISPIPTIRHRHCPPTVGKVPKILLDITKQNTRQPDFLTPEKKLLNSIDKVEKAVMEELQRLKRTPTAKRAEREKKVRTLMSFR